MQADLVVVDAKALNLWPAHDPITAALQASIANTEAVMIAGRWRKRHYTLVDSNIVEVKERLWQSGERFTHAFHAAGPVARPRRRVVHTVVRRHLRRQTHSDNERGRQECNWPRTGLRMQRNYKFETFVALRLWRPVGAKCRRLQD
jgi:5-methylthioadenosine/S-adenosylhomocysteine deaminase